MNKFLSNHKVRGNLKYWNPLPTQLLIITEYQMNMKNMEKYQNSDKHG